MRTKWIYTMFVLALSLFTSCNNEVDEAAGNKKTRTVVFRLSVDDAVGSRAAWGDISDNDYNRQDGVGIENRIDLNGLRVAIYSIKADGTVDARVGVADHLLYWSTDANDKGNDSKDPIEYQLVGDISDVELVDGKEYRFMVYANFPHTTNNQFDLDDIGVENGYIPMWGVTTYQITGGEMEDLGTIDLLRAAAKVEVIFNEAVTNEYDVINLSIMNYNSKGNNLPTGWNSCVNTKALDRENCINVTADHVHGTSLSFENGKYYIYLPEYANTKHPEDPSVVQVTLKKKNSDLTKTYPISFCKYDTNGAPEAASVYDIVRNHIYQFNVTGVKGNSLLLNFEVADWNYKELQSGETENENNLNLGSLTYPNYVNPLLPEKGYDYPNLKITVNPKMKFVPKVDDGNGNVTNNEERENAGFNAYFHFIAANKNDITGYPWLPNIIGGSTAEYTIKVYQVVDNGDKTLVYDSSKNGSDQGLKTNYTGWFRIVVIPEEQETNAIVSLGITCTIHPSGFPSDDFFLFINGENDKIAWPNSGNDRKFIQITQTE